ncbi:MAG: dihydrolipoyl dehydrogenase [Candidatus Nanohalobium sp.]
MKEFDLVVVGSGSGLDVASAYVRKGMDVAVVEKGSLGGTCLNRGCIPSKMLLHRADVVDTVESSERFGVDAEVRDVDFQGIVERVNEDVSGDAESIREGLESSEGHTLYSSEACFVDDRVLEVGGERITGDRIVVAAGSRPFIPPIEGLEDVDYITSREALKLEERPDKIVMLGGGYITMELAYFYSRMGSDVSIIERNDRLLSQEDRDVSEKLTGIAEEEYDVYLDAEASRVEETDGRVKVHLEDEVVEGDELLVATGRQPNTDLLNVEETGIETDRKGFIQVDEHMETSVDGVYALGDIADNWMFKHSANLEAEYVTYNSLQGNEHALPDIEMPHAVFTDPQVAGIGKTEQELEDGYISATYNYSDTAMGMAMKTDGFVKVLASEEGEILGCHIIGPEASTLIHEVLVSMHAGSKNVADIQNTVHIHPALNEVVQRAFDRIRRQVSTTTT